MGIIATATPPGSDEASLVYLRIDGLHVVPVPIQRRSWDTLRQAAQQDITAAVTGADAGTVGVQVYAYASAEARSARAAPLWSTPFRTSLNELQLTAEFTPSDLWAALYARLSTVYADATSDLEARLPVS